MASTVRASKVARARLTVVVSVEAMAPVAIRNRCTFDGVFHFAPVTPVFCLTE